jgi:hypothetical protein
MNTKQGLFAWAMAFALILPMANAFGTEGIEIVYEITLAEFQKGVLKKEVDEAFATSKSKPLPEDGDARPFVNTFLSDIEAYFMLKTIDERGDVLLRLQCPAGPKIDLMVPGNPVHEIELFAGQHDNARHVSKQGFTSYSRNAIVWKSAIFVDGKERYITKSGVGIGNGLPLGSTYAIGMLPISGDNDYFLLIRVMEGEAPVIEDETFVESRQERQPARLPIRLGQRIGNRR